MEQGLVHQGDCRKTDRRHDSTRGSQNTDVPFQDSVVSSSRVEPVGESGHFAQVSGKAKLRLPSFAPRSNLPPLSEEQMSPTAAHASSELCLSAAPSSEYSASAYLSGTTSSRSSRPSSWSSRPSHGTSTAASRRSCGNELPTDAPVGVALFDSSNFNGSLPFQRTFSESSRGSKAVRYFSHSPLPSSPPTPPRRSSAQSVSLLERQENEYTFKGYNPTEARRPNPHLKRVRNYGHIGWSATTSRASTPALGWASSSGSSLSLRAPSWHTASTHFRQSSSLSVSSLTAVAGAGPSTSADEDPSSGERKLRRRRSVPVVPDGERSSFAQPKPACRRSKSCVGHVSSERVRLTRAEAFQRRASLQDPSLRIPQPTSSSSSGSGKERRAFSVAHPEWILGTPENLAQASTAKLSIPLPYQRYFTSTSILDTPPWEKRHSAPPQPPQARRRVSLWGAIKGYTKA